MNIGGRKRLILQAIIEDYISTAEPVGSRTISKKYLTSTSPATIRNEMADLEDMGYIEQPHTSAGRVPSDKGYRLYVDGIMEQKAINDAQRDIIKKEFVDTLGEIDRLVKHASKLLSQLTQYTSIVTTPQIRKTSLKHIQLMKLDSSTVLAVIVTNAGIVKNSVLRLKRDVTTDNLDKITNMLNEVLVGMNFEELENANIDYMISNSANHAEIIDQILPELVQTLLYSDTADIYHDGAANILNLPEYSDINKARSFLNTLEEKDLLLKVLNEAQSDIGISIGKENKYEELKDCSLITATYKINGKVVGSVGVLGPTRMEYNKVISVVDCMTNNLSEILTKILKT